MTIGKIKFQNYKSLKNYSVEIRDINILTGSNNGGKSTILGAFKILDACLRKANSKRPEFIRFPDGENRQGYKISLDGIAISTENISTDYNDEPSLIEFTLHNNNAIKIHLHDSICHMETSTKSKRINSTNDFKTAFPISLCIIPTLGPLEQKEQIVTDETVRISASSHRASRHFRNYWNKNPENWDQFASLVESTWPGMQIKKPEIVPGNDPHLQLFCAENRIDREVAWAGFGFQVWLQLLTHISRCKENDILIIDEPEIYLHPEVQRQLLSILKGTGASIILATHSTEIIGEADPLDLLLIDKKKTKAERLRDIQGIQRAIDALGSIHNVTLAQLARNRKMVFSEGKNDQKIIRKFAKILGYNAVAAGNGITFFESGGFTSQDKIHNMTEGMKQTLSVPFEVCAVYDRDFFCDEQVNDSTRHLEEHLKFVHFHKRKEIENYLLNTEAIIKATERELYQRGKDFTESEKLEVCSIIKNEIETQKNKTLSQLLAKKNEYYKKSGKDPATISMQLLQEFENNWVNPEYQLEKIPGKEVLKSIREEISSRHGVTISDSKILDAYRKNSIPHDMVELVSRLNSFCLSK
ncbi:ATP-dependent nuclease [Chromobacterium phragmitis]|uniref:AAA family ATPase n=5 Tax=Chromobacterium TaxID=535 RepID=A0ABV0IV76_9NEIS